MATFLSKVRNITKSTTGETSDASVVTFLQSGVSHVFTSIPKRLLWFLASDGSNITSGSGQAVAPDTIISVKRNGYPCELVDFSISKFLEDSSSLHYALATYPKYYIESGKVYIKPDPTVSAVGVVSRITVPTIATDTDADTATYSDIQNMIINYAAGMDFSALASYYGNAIASDSDVTTALTALNAAADRINVAVALANTQFDSAVTELSSQEDVELSNGYVQAGNGYLSEAQMALNEAQAYLTEVQGRAAFMNSRMQVIGSYNEASKRMFEIVEREIKTYIDNNQQTVDTNVSINMQAARGGR